MSQTRVAIISGEAKRLRELALGDVFAHEGRLYVKIFAVGSAERDADEILFLKNLDKPENLTMKREEHDGEEPAPFHVYDLKEETFVHPVKDAKFTVVL